VGHVKTQLGIGWEILHRLEIAQNNRSDWQGLCNLEVKNTWAMSKHNLTLAGKFYTD
jgi:hypothetical protein